MKYFLFYFIILFATLSSSTAQTFEVDTLRYHGDIKKYINVVIMGDGYTVAEQDSFILDAKNLSDYLFSQVPWSNYTGYFNVFAIKVISSQSGITHPGTAIDVLEPVFPVSSVNTYFNTTFDDSGIHRLVAPQNTYNVASVLAANFPAYDQVLIVANSPYYGGSGGPYATSTTDMQSNEVTAHELGHSFAYLADEYYAGDVYAIEKPNMTMETDPSLVKWKNWMGYNGTGIYQHCCGGNSASWYRPNNNCKMRYLGNPYCCVCTQALIESVHNLVNPLVNYTPVKTSVTSANQYLDFKLTELMKPAPNTLHVVWKLDTSVVGYNLEAVQLDQNTLSPGTHTLTVTVTDTTALLRVDNHPTIHFSTVTWTINVLAAGVELSSASNKISYAVYPNPTQNFLHLEFEVKNKSKVSLQLVSTDGQVMQQIENRTMEGFYSNTLDIGNLPAGSYLLVLKVDDAVYQQTVVKQ